MASSSKGVGTSGKRLKAASASAEDRAVKVVEEVAASKAWELLQEKLQEGGEALVNKLLNFCQCGAAEPSTLQDSTPYRRNLSKMGDLSLKELKFVWESFHGSAWAEHICKTVRLASGRSLLFWAVQAEAKDLLPGQTLGDLRAVCLRQYQQSQPQHN